MRFTCEQCGKRYTTNDVLQPGRMYRTKCKACGNIIVVKGSAEGGSPPETGAPAPTPSPAAIPSSSRPVAPLNPPSAPAVVTPPPMPAAAATPAAPAGPEPKYIDLFEGESLDDLAPSVAPGHARRKGAIPPPTPEPQSRPASLKTPPTLGQAHSSPAVPVPSTSPAPSADATRKQTRPPAYFGDVQPAAAEPTPPPPPDPSHPREPRRVVTATRRGRPLVAAGVLVALIVAGVAVAVTWRPWEKPSGGAVATLPSPTTPVRPQPPPPEPPAAIAPVDEPTPEPVVAEPTEPQPSPEELARIAKEREREERLAKAEQERLARLEKLEREKAEKVARAEEARLARLEKLEREKAEKAARIEQARLARLEKLEREKAEKAAKIEQARLEKLEKAEKEKADRAARAEQERLAKLERERAEREKADREKADREKTSKAEQERLAKLPAGLSANAIQTALASGKKSFDECVKNPWRGLERPLDIRQLRLRFTVQPQGKVTAAAIDDPTASNAPVGVCLKAAAAALPFPEFRGDPVQMDTPILLPVAPAPPPTVASSGTDPVNVVVFTGPKSTRAGSEVGDTVYSERSEDAVITEHLFENGVVTYVGQVGFGKGSTWAGIGLNVNILPDAKPIDATRFKSVTFRLASPTTRSLRLRIVGNDVKISQMGCYPTTLIRVSKELKDYTFSFKDFDPETWCGANGRNAAKTIPQLVGFEIADINIQGKPSSFSVGTITLNP